MCLLVLVCAVTAFSGKTAAPAAAPESAAATAAATAEATAETAPAEEKEYLSLWTDDSRLKQELTAYINAITDESGPDFIPVDRRIATFDLDGTLFCETDPVYFDHMLLMHRVTEDPDYKDKASDYEKEVCGIIQKWIDTGESPSDLEILHGTAVATAFAGMTIDEFDAYVKKFAETPQPGYEGMKRGDAYYKPMLEVIDYLQANDFTVYVVSGTDRLMLRPMLDGHVNIPPRQIIGSDDSLVASNMGDKDGREYQFTAEDKLILGGNFLTKDVKMNKVSVIMQEIGSQPVLSFGNSTGDSSMSNFTITNNPYRSMAFMLCCDDLVRENGNEEKANKMYALCKENGWVPVSMKNDWKTIYGDGVTRKTAE